ncbi:disease resistance protein RGA3 [Canna indica]|uniref:Disease resistance protein RGA3 n=1 Tax=Canna indica TaxID=4628 RepID=A0AAQ3Q6Y4_9LILI|nr:disease resistance protein RGA3 [Canna indica]
MAIILDALIGTCIETIASFIGDKMVTVLQVRDELETLQRRLERISCVLKDAERRSQDSAINNWLKELKDVVYDSDDILDLCRIEGGKLLLDHPSPSVRPKFPLLTCFTGVHLRHEIGNRIRTLNKRLEEISSDKLMLKLQPVNPDVLHMGVNPRRTSHLIEQDIVGNEINDATEDLVDFLTCKSEMKCSLCTITGMPGIGKTTLAQKVFNDPVIEDMFQVRVWICVSQKFSEIDLLKEIIRGTGMKCGEEMTKAELLPMLRDAVRGKSFLLVLDDVWQADVWVDLLRKPIQSGVANGRILAITRDQNIAYQMGSIRIHEVKLLPVDSGWELLCKKAFVDGGEEEIENLRDVGFKIVAKCKGLPLAIKVVGSLLATKQRSRREWEKVACSDAWSMSKLPKELSEALYLSYEDLPSHLKQCFLYCSLFPEDYVLHKETLVRLWVAEGFVKLQGNAVLEDVAEEYWWELQRRSLLQPQPGVLSLVEKPCVMHDSLRSLAQFLSEDECFCGDANWIKTTSTSKLRRLSVSSKEERVAIPDSVMAKKCLRTLMILKTPPVIENNLLSRLSQLRVLLLNGRGIKIIPDSIGSLIHLRYLDLRKTSISRLPESIEHLSNLLTLNLMDCCHLNSIPQGVTRLHNLRRLGLFNAGLSKLPRGIGRLKHLNDISGFIVGDENNRGEGCDFEELNSLSELRKLSIFNLERASSGGFVLFHKSHLTRLAMLCTPYSSRHQNGLPYTEEDIVKIERVCEELRPPPCLEEELWFGGFFGRVFPSWMMSSLGVSFPYLNRLFLHRCELCQQLPPLGQLPQLKYLHIARANAIVSIGHEFLAHKAQRAASAIVFPKLEVCVIEDMPNWETWSFGKEDAPLESWRQMPRLREMIVGNCPKLSALPGGSQEVDSNQGLVFPALSRLTIDNCPALEYVEKQDALEHLKLVNKSMESLPQWLPPLIQGRRRHRFKLEVFCNLSVLKRCLDGAPDWPIVREIPVANIYSYTTNGRASLHYAKETSYYATINI